MGIINEATSRLQEVIEGMPSSSEFDIVSTVKLGPSNEVLTANYNIKLRKEKKKKKGNTEETENN